MGEPVAEEGPLGSSPASALEPAQAFAFVLMPNFSMIAFTSAIEPLRIANRHVRPRAVPLAGGLEVRRAGAGEQRRPCDDRPEPHRRYRRARG